MTLTIRIPSNNLQEREYIINVLFKDFLGLDHKIIRDDVVENYEIELSNNSKLVIKDSFFNKYKLDNEYLDQKNIPSEVKYMTYGPKPESVPIIFGDPKIDMSATVVNCHADLFACAFFMLSRWEEAVSNSTDSHNRFPAQRSLAYKNDFLDKPVVNQYVEILWNMLEHLGYSGQRASRDFKVEVSHDVDAPFKYAFMPIPNVIKMFVADIVKRKSVLKAFRNVFNCFTVKTGDLSKDPFNTFDFIMNTSKRFGLKSTFFFICERKNRRYDGYYEISDRKIVQLMQAIDKRGHHIGLHGSYDSYNSSQIGIEFSELKKVCKKSGIKQKIRCSRQHFLRWKTPDTFQHLEDSGIEYDSTLTYGDRPGFRTGSCYPFPVFNVRTRKPLKLIEKPLIVMECSLLAKRYLNLSYDDAFLEAEKLKNECMKYNGVFTMLWHNNELDTDEKQELYVKILKECNNG